MTTTAIVIRRDAVLARLEVARGALAKAKDLQTVKKIADMAAAAKVYAQQQKLGDDAIGYAHAVKYEALRRLGELLAVMEKAKGTRGQGRPRIGGPEREPPISAPTLAELGLDKKVSAAAQQLAMLPADLFARVKANEASVAEVLRELAHASRPTVALPTTSTFRVVYADPPWQYGNSGVIGESDNYGHVARHYPSMSIAELCALPVARLVDDDAVLFLWVTSPLLAESFAVVDAWGFTYKTSFVWDKVRHNFGHYNSVRHEFLLVCTRGSCTPDIETKYDSVQTIERSDRHSEKPEEFRNLIDCLYPSGRRIELFARRDAPPSWATWGNEAIA